MKQPRQLESFLVCPALPLPIHTALGYPVQKAMDLSFCPHALNQYRFQKLLLQLLLSLSLLLRLFLLLLRCCVYCWYCYCCRCCWRCFHFCYLSCAHLVWILLSGRGYLLSSCLSVCLTVCVVVCSPNYLCVCLNRTYLLML